MKNTGPYLTILTILFGFLMINHFLKSDYIYYSIIVISGLSLISSKFSKYIELIWFKLSFVLSQIIPNILLSLIFFSFLTPLSLLSKLLKSKSDFLVKNNSKSTFISMNKKFSKETFERAW